MYTNMSIVDAAKSHPYEDTLSPKRFGTVSPLDPELFSRIDDFADALLKGESDGKYSPIEVAHWLHGLAETAAKQLTEAESKSKEGNTPEFRRLAADVRIESGLGRFFAWKFQAGVLYRLFDRSGHPPALREALIAYRAARMAWATDRLR